MTTLPQINPVRPVHGTMLGIGSPHLPAMPGAGGPVVGGLSGTDVWRIIRNNFWLIVLFLVLFGGIGYGVNRLMLMYMPRYRVEGMLQVDARHTGSIVNDQVIDAGDAQLLAELRTQMQFLTSDELFSTVLKNPTGKVRETSWYRDFEQPGRFSARNAANQAKESLQDYFRATPVADSRVLRVSFEAPNGQDAKIVLEEIVNAHLRNEQNKAKGRFSDQTTALRSVSVNLAAEAANAAKQANAKQLQLADEGMAVGQGGFSTREVELRTLIDARVKAMADAAEASRGFDSIETQVKSGEKVAKIEESVEMDPTVASLAREILSMEIQRDTIRDRLGPDHQDIKRYDRQIEIVNKKLEDRRDEMRARVRTQYLEALRNRRDATKAEVDVITTDINKLKERIGELSKELANWSVIHQQEISLREQKASIDAKLRDLEGAANLAAQSRISWAARPELPETPSFPKLKITLPIALVLGLALALGIAFLRELMNDTIRSPRDLARVEHLNLLGIIADEGEDPEVADARLAIFDAPHSITAEQFRQVRTRLAHAASLETSRSILVTGPGPEDGKTTVAANLAAGLALNGRRILLVDANFRRPELHRLFGIANESGFSDVLDGRSKLDAAAISTRVPNLSVLPSGQRPPNATELLESQLFADFLEQATSAYEHVIFDSAPMLVVAEPAAMASRVDGVITVVRAHAESRGLLQRMRDTLRQLKAENIGVVLNAVRYQGGGYYRRSIRTYYDYQAEA